MPFVEVPILLHLFLWGRGISSVQLAHCIFTHFWHTLLWTHFAHLRTQNIKQLVWKYAIWDPLLIPPCVPEGARTQRKQSPRVCNSNCASLILYVTCLSQKSSRGWKLQPRLLSEKHLELTSSRELGVHRSLLSEIIKCQVFCFVYFQHGFYPYSVLWFIWVGKKNTSSMTNMSSLMWYRRVTLITK